MRLIADAGCQPDDWPNQSSCKRSPTISPPFPWPAIGDFVNWGMVIGVDVAVLYFW